MPHDADGNFEQKNLQLYKCSTPVSPSFYLKLGSIKCLNYTPVKNREECIKSSLHLLVCAHAWITKRKQRLPLSSGFYQLFSKPNLDWLTVGYLPPSSFSPTEATFIAAEIRIMQDMMKEVETDFIFIKADQVKYTKVILYMSGFRYEHATYNLQLFQKIWYSTAPFLSRP